VVKPAISADALGLVTSAVDETMTPSKQLRLLSKGEEGPLISVGDKTDRARPRNATQRELGSHADPFVPEYRSKTKQLLVLYRYTAAAPTCFAQLWITFRNSTMNGGRIWKFCISRIFVS
jgi:hypothetical protein